MKSLIPLASSRPPLTNLVGNGVATLVVARWCGALDDQRLRNALEAAKPEAAIPPAPVVTDAGA